MIVRCVASRPRRARLDLDLLSPRPYSKSRARSDYAAMRQAPTTNVARVLRMHGRALAHGEPTAPAQVGFRSRQIWSHLDRNPDLRSGSAGRTRPVRVAADRLLGLAEVGEFRLDARGCRPESGGLPSRRGRPLRTQDGAHRRRRPERLRRPRRLAVRQGGGRHPADGQLGGANRHGGRRLRRLHAGLAPRVDAAFREGRRHLAGPLRRRDVGRGVPPDAERRRARR